MTIQSLALAIRSPSKRSHWVMRWLVIVMVSAAVPTTAAGLLFLAYWNVTETKPPSWGWDGKPSFFETKYHKIVLPQDSSSWQRIKVACLNLEQRYGPKNPAKHSFPPNFEWSCSIKAYLEQCMAFTGTKYLIAEEVAYVDFGYSNTINGAEWVAAFEQALQTNQPACWHPASNGVWQENLLLVRERPRLVKLIPPSRLADYQKAGLVSSSFIAPAVSSQTSPAK